MHAAPFGHATQLTHAHVPRCMSPHQVSDPTNGVPGYGLSENGKLEAARAGEQIADDYYGKSAVEVISSDFCRSG
jgi:hypothetical protein